MLNNIAERIRSDFADWQLGVYFEDLQDGEMLAVREKQAFPSASVIKVPVAVHILAEAARGEIDLGQTVELPLSDPAYSQPDGSGVLTDLTSHIALNVRDLLLLSLAISDNLATNELLNLTTFDAINSTLAAYGLTDTRITVPISDFALLAQSNFTTAQEMGHLLRLLHQRELPSSDELLAMMQRQRYTARIPYLLPDDDDREIAHKTGTLREYAHDVGIVYDPRFSYIIVLLLHHQAEGREASMTLAQVSKIIYDYMVAKYRS